MNPFSSKLSAVTFSISIFVFLSLSFSCVARKNDPEIPVIERPVHVTDHKDYERPYMPVYRTTHDGRIGVNFEEGVQVYLNSPEKFSTQFHESPNGQALLASTEAYRFSKGLIHDSVFGVQNHVSFCEPTHNQGQTKNPYACGVDQKDDCYDIIFITFAWADNTQTHRQMWGTSSTVRVTNPKTPQAQVADVVLGSPEASSHLFSISNVFEPMFTQDGNLMVGRVEKSEFTWHNKRTDLNVTGRYDMVYFPAPQDPAQSCNIHQWDEIKPLGHAPYDPEINQTYGFAMQPFVNSFGHIIPDERDLAGSYPWIDSKGDNIGFSVLTTNLLTDEFPISCVDKRGCDDESLPAEEPPLMGKTIAGLWTQGKMILLDGLVNNIDYTKPQMEDRGHRMLNMYKAGTRADGSGGGLVRVGNGRDNFNSFNGMAEGAAGNTSFLESIENKLHFWDHLKPVTPGDVVWHVSTGASSDEIAFDDYLNPDSFINSSMVQAVLNDGNTARQQNGIAGAPYRIQNGATALANRWLVPEYGEVTNARIERVAMGGIKGKGLWLSGNDAFITYGLAAQPQPILEHDWYMGLFVDARFDNDTTQRTLLSFPDGSEVILIGRDTVAYWFDNEIKHQFKLPTAIPQPGWAHLGWQLSKGNQSIDFYFNGFLFNSFTAPEAIFQFKQGNLFVGDTLNRVVPSFKGWIDEFKVFAQAVNSEVACNHANGTLVGLEQGADAWLAKANLYPESSHQALSDVLSHHKQAVFSRYVCYLDYSDDYRAHQYNIPQGAVGLRDAINFPEGPLIFDLPRPDSSDNLFCLSCHTSEGQQGLSLSALTLNGDVLAMDDPRRQPNQPPARVYGNIPANWLGDGLPALDMIAPSEGLAIDEWLLTEQRPKQTAPKWPVGSVSPGRSGQSLLQQSSGMELRVKDGGVSLGFKPASYELFDWVLSDAGDGFVFIDNPQTFKRLSQSLDTQAVTTVDSPLDNPVIEVHAQWKLENVDEQWHYIINRQTGQKLQALNSHNYTLSMAQNDITGNNVHWQLVDYVKKYSKPEVDLCVGVDVPKVNVFANHASNEVKANGGLTFTFRNDAEEGGTRTHLKFSLNGGKKYDHKVADKLGFYRIKQLTAGEYDIRAAWGNNECPIELGVITINPERDVECSGADVPFASAIATEESAPFLNDGSITFVFEDDVNQGGIRNQIMFSLDGGNTFQLPVKDSKGKQTITGVAAGTYDLWAAWGGGACLTDIEDVTVRQRQSTDVCGQDTPHASVTFEHESKTGASDGSITFHFEDDALKGGRRKTLKFSVNGGKSFGYKSKDSALSQTISDLTAGVYDVRIAWGNTSCQVNLPNIELITLNTDSPIVACEGIDAPNAQLSHQNETGVDLNDGVIQFEFINDAIAGGQRGEIKFSLDGGQRYTHKVKDNLGITQITDLRPGEYNVWVAWGNGECATALKPVTIARFIEPEFVFGIEEDGTVFHSKTEHTAEWQYICLNDDCRIPSYNNERWEYQFDVNDDDTYTILFKVQDTNVGQCIASYGSIKRGEKYTFSSCAEFKVFTGEYPE